MKKLQSLLLLSFLLIYNFLASQMQWYQNQDGNNPSPYGTYCSSVQSFNSGSFIGCYQWRVNNDLITWKISKTDMNGKELKSFFVTGSYSMAEVKVGRFNSVYVLQRNFPAGQNAEYILYKLDHNLNIKSQKTIIGPGNFNIISLNAFELDNSGNIYLAGDGQYTALTGLSPASFVLKTDRNLISKWNRIDSSVTSYARLHIDRHGRLLVLQDHTDFYPAVRVTRINANGSLSSVKDIATTPNRYNLFSALDGDDNLLLYGGKTIDDTEQGVYLIKISGRSGRTVFNKTYFGSPGTQLNDLKIDRQGNIFSLVSQYFGPDEQESKISRINPFHGNILWNRSFSFSQDSSLLAKLVMGDNERFYVVGEKRSQTYFSKGLAIRMKKNGQMENRFQSPDSVAFNRSHMLVDGITNDNNQLIAVGNTNDFDTLTFSSSYYRSFAAKFGTNKCGSDDKEELEKESVIAEAVIANESKTDITGPKLSIYPNPVQDQLFISNINNEEYDNLVVYDIRGALLLQQSVNGKTSRLDVSTLKNGVYMLVIRSSVLLIEKTIRFVVHR